jgi:ubiquinone biosynthesis protein Coq4
MMAYENNNDFADWLYNRYVEALRKNDTIRALVFLDVMNQYFIKALTQRRFSKQKRYTGNLLKSIEKAHKNGTANKLTLLGEEWQREFEKAIADYERNLRAMDFNEEHIRELIIEKKYNYGNE